MEPQFELLELRNHRDFARFQCHREHLIEGPLVDLQLRSVTLHVSQGNAGGLFHNVAQLTREYETTLTGHGCCFDEEHVTAGARYRQARRNTRSRRARGCLVMDLLPA